MENPIVGYYALESVGFTTNTPLPVLLSTIYVKAGC